MDNTILLNEADIRLTRVGEIRFGPELYKLTIANEQIKDSSFLNYHLHAKELNLFIVAEYIYSDRTKFSTQLMLLDLINGKRTIYGRLEKGLIKPKQIENGNLIFTRESGDGITKEYEVPLEKIDGWKSV